MVERNGMEQESAVAPRDAFYTGIFVLRQYGRSNSTRHVAERRTYNLERGPEAGSTYEFGTQAFSEVGQEAAHTAAEDNALRAIGNVEDLDAPSHRVAVIGKRSFEFGVGTGLKQSLGVG
jgi:hypothetical protein